ncbi:MAG: PDZ domain-containing protein [Pirellulaceae bacterium]|nr:PDZ domain-containing protein [Pirellulaceae bacterium]
MTRSLPLAIVLTVTALSVPVSSVMAQNFKFSPSAAARSTRSISRPSAASNSGFRRISRPSALSPPVSRGGFQRAPITRPPVNLGGVGRLPRPGVNIPRVPLNPGKVVTPIRPGVLNPGFKPGFKPTLPVNPGGFGKLPVNPMGGLGKLPVRPIGGLGKFPVTPAIGNALKPNLTGKLNGVKNFETLVGKLPNQKFTPIQLDKLNGKLGAIGKAKDLQLKSIQGAKAKSMAIQKLSLAPHCHWWVDFCMGWHWHHHHCHWWDYCYTPGYWHCWTPCHYHVVYCPPTPGYVATTWYFGVECVLIPDMASYGIQKVQPNSPAALAGLMVGDMIVSINGRGIADDSVLQREIQSSGGLLQLGVVRDGAAEPVRVDVALRRVRTISY